MSRMYENSDHVPLGDEPAPAAETPSKPDTTHGDEASMTLIEQVVRQRERAGKPATTHGRMYPESNHNLGEE